MINHILILYLYIQGHFGLSSTEEMEMAIENCKELIGRAQPHSDRHKNLVQKLVQLRLKLQELKVQLCTIQFFCLYRIVYDSINFLCLFRMVYNTYIFVSVWLEYCMIKFLLFV